MYCRSLFFDISSYEKRFHASPELAGRQMDVWLKSMPSEMSPEGSLPKADSAGFHKLDERYH